MSNSSKKRDRWESSSSEEEDNNNNHNDEYTPSTKLSKSSTTTTVIETTNHILLSKQSIVPKDTNEINHSSTQTPNKLIIELSKHNPLLNGCRLVYDSYERIKRLDEGTYVSQTPKRTYCSHFS